MRIPTRLCASLLFACSQSTVDDASSGDDAITSHDANILSFTFTGHVTAGADTATRAAIVSQLAYVQGNLAPMSATLLRAFADADHPKSFDDLLATMPPEHLLVVFGEEDNRFHP